MSTLCDLGRGAVLQNWFRLLTDNKQLNRYQLQQRSDVGECQQNTLEVVRVLQFHRPAYTAATGAPLWDTNGMCCGEVAAAKDADKTPETS